MLRPSTLAAGLVLVVFVLSNLLSDGFPLRHVKRGGEWHRGYFIKVPGPGEEPREPWTEIDHVPDAWDGTALKANVLIGTSAVLLAAIVGLAVERRRLAEPV